MPIARLFSSIFIKSTNRIILLSKYQNAISISNTQHYRVPLRLKNNSTEHNLAERCTKASIASSHDLFFTKYRVTALRMHAVARIICLLSNNGRTVRVILLKNRATPGGKLINPFPKASQERKNYFTVAGLVPGRQTVLAGNTLARHHHGPIFSTITPK